MRGRVRCGVWAREWREPCRVPSWVGAGVHGNGRGGLRALAGAAWRHESWLPHVSGQWVEPASEVGDMLGRSACAHVCL